MPNWTTGESCLLNRRLQCQCKPAPVNLPFTAAASPWDQLAERVLRVPVHEAEESFVFVALQEERAGVS